jgi:N-acetyl-alpha-D-glucosaminyl L-malate synthase BshA
LPITRFSINQSDGVTSISDYLKQQTVEVFDVQTPIAVIPNFVNCDLYERTSEVVKRRAEYASADEKILIHLSNFRPVKRIPDVIEIFDRVQKRIPARLLMIGDGPERSRAEWLAVNKGIHNKVEFLGKQDRIHEKLGVGDVMLLPSQLESFGLAALEAMACEVVPIATNVGGIPEVIDHGKTGFLANVGDVDAMAHHAIEILSDESKLRGMGEQARASAQARFCASKIIPMYERYYRDVLERSS